VGIVSDSGPDGKPRAGAVSTSGKFVIPRIYESLSQTRDGYMFGKKDGRELLLNSRGHVIAQFPAECSSVEIPDKLAADVWIPCGFGGTEPRKSYRGMRGSKWGYCDKSGKICIQPQFSYCGPFVGNFAPAWVGSDSDNNQLCGAIDRAGRWVLPPRYQWVGIADNRFIVPGSGPEPLKTAETPKSFDKLLYANNFIDMSKNEVDKKLGNSGRPGFRGQVQPAICTKTVVYDIITDPRCGGGVSFEFGYDKDEKCLGWRALQNGGWNQYQWITEDVVLRDPRHGFDVGNLIPKSDLHAGRKQPTD